MVAFRARHSAQERPSTFLEVEMTEEQAAILAPTVQDLSVQSTLKDAGGTGATKKTGAAQAQQRRRHPQCHPQ
jgi:hypothetical protein